MKAVLALIVFVCISILMSFLGYGFWVLFGSWIENLARSILSVNVLSVYTTITTIGTLIMVFVRKYL
jgi:hypothetical protein